jgi:phage terminase large subunit
MRTTRVFKDNFFAYRDGKRRALNEGGTYSSKTWSILYLLILIAQKNELLISVVSESLPHLKRGAIRDFFRILGVDPDNNPYYNKTEHIYNFSKGKIEFFGADESDKVRGPRRHILFINEGNNVPWETARGLDIRTEKFTFVDWNPVGEFWAHEHWIGQPENAYIHSNYQDAIGVLPPEVIDNIESNRDKDPNWWNIYGLGLIGKVEGLIYPLFIQVDSLPEQGELVYGLDFGFSGDPASLTKHKIFPNEIFSQELFFERGLTNQDIAARMVDLGVAKHSDEIWADSAEPKSIEEIYQQGFNIKGAPKGPGSVEYGHQKVRQYKQYWTKDSLNCIKEQRNFRYMADKNGKLTEKTTHAFSHGMDSRRYAVMGYSEEPEPEESVIIYDSMAEVKELELI